MSQNVGTESAPKAGLSTGTKVAIGCGVVLVVCVVGCLALAIGGGLFFKHKIEAFTKTYVDQGYHKVEGAQLTVSDKVTEKTLYQCQSVAIMAGSDADLAILAPEATIYGKVNGDVHFMGTRITIEKDAEITGSLDVTAQTVNVYGAVDGSVTGIKQILNNQGRIGPATSAPQPQSAAPAPSAPAAESTGA